MFTFQIIFEAVTSFIWGQIFTGWRYIIKERECNRCNPKTNNHQKQHLFTQCGWLTPRAHRPLIKLGCQDGVIQHSKCNYALQKQVQSRWLKFAMENRSSYPSVRSVRYPLTTLWEHCWAEREKRDKSWICFPLNTCTRHVLRCKNILNNFIAEM